MNLLDLNLAEPAKIIGISGERAFRRRLFELGLVPGTEVAVVRLAPFGGPIELSVRGCHLSIRRQEAAEVEVAASRAGSPPH